MPSATARSCRRIFTQLCEQVAADLQRKGYVGRTIGIKLRFDDFRTVTRDLTLAEATADAAVIRRAAGAVPEAGGPEARLRLLGVRAGALAKAGQAAAGRRPRAVEPRGTGAHELPFDRSDASAAKLTRSRPCFEHQVEARLRRLEESRLSRSRSSNDGRPIGRPLRPPRCRGRSSGRRAPCSPLPNARRTIRPAHEAAARSRRRRRS